MFQAVVAAEQCLASKRFRITFTSLFCTDLDWRTQCYCSERVKKIPGLAAQPYTVLRTGHIADMEKSTRIMLSCARSRRLHGPSRLGTLLSEADNGRYQLDRLVARRKSTTRLQPKDAQGVPAKECCLLFTRQLQARQSSKAFHGT